MPKLFSIAIDVEEVALGRVMRLLHNTPGVAKFDLDLGKSKANGADPSKGEPRNRMTGREFMIKLFSKAKRPLRSNDLKSAFGKSGRSPRSISSVIHYLKNERMVETKNGEGYVATQLLKQRARKAKS